MSPPKVSPPKADPLHLDATEDGESEKVADAAAQLADELEAAKDARNEERFVWIVICTILVDVLWFRDATNPILPLVVLVLELLVLVVLARRMGIDDVVGLLDRLLHSVGRGAGGGN